MKGFWKYFRKKLIWYFVTFLIALFLNFLLPRLIPGNPVDLLLADMLSGVTDTARATEIRQSTYNYFGLDKPLIQQFFIYVNNVFHGNLGRSFNQYPRLVSDILAQSLPWTIAIQLPSLIIGWIVGNILGAVAAYRKGIFDRIIFPLSLFFSSIPVFVLALLMKYYLGVYAHWFPMQGAYDAELMPSATFTFYWSLFRHWQLPFLATCLVMIGGQAIGMRSMSLYELNADYVLYAKLLGIPENKITKYVFKNAVLPQITGLALSLGTMISGALITEIVFSYPGIGTQLVNAIHNVDYTLISGCTLFISITALIANFTIEIIYGLIDPRIRTIQMEEE